MSSQKSLIKPAVSLRIFEELELFRDAIANKSKTRLAIRLYLKRRKETLTDLKILCDKASTDISHIIVCIYPTKFGGDLN